MEIALIIIGIAILLVLVVLFVRLKSLQDSGKNQEGMLLLNQNIQGVQERIDATTKTLNDRLDNAARVIVGVQKELGVMSEIGRSMKDVQDFLKSPKLRGNLGEQVLHDILEQHFPKTHFEMQYKFRSGEAVDAAIKTRDGIVPIDSKFPMENFQKLMAAQNDADRDAARKDFLKDVKKHINDISRKYILPAEGTVDFALMYVPSEAVYYEIIREHTDTMTFAYQSKVYLVSPNSFYFFMQAILNLMRGERIAEEAQKIITTLAAIQKDSEKFADVLGILNTHVTNSKNAMDRVNAEYMKLEGKIEQTKMLQ